MTVVLLGDGISEEMMAMVRDILEETKVKGEARARNSKSDADNATRNISQRTKRGEI